MGILIGYVHFVICMLVIARAFCNAQQRFAETPPNYLEVSAGQDVQLRCVVLDKKGQCVWQKNRDAVGIQKNKYEWVGNHEGDCTLLIRNASLEYDDGKWQCQVTASDFTQQDALTSEPSRLLVRVQPRQPILKHNGALLNTALILREGQEETVSCTSSYGNPAALIKWFIGDYEIEHSGESNQTERDFPKTWAAISTVRVRGTRNNHNLSIRCLAFHPAIYNPLIAESRLDVRYSPEVRMEMHSQNSKGPLEDSAGNTMILRCIANSNPISKIKWYKNKSPISEIYDSDQQLSQNVTSNGTFVISEFKFEPIKREDAGNYSCTAINDIGESTPAIYKVDVQFGPRLNSSNIYNNATEEKTAELSSTVVPFECEEFEANPPAKYRWTHSRGGIVQTIDFPYENTVGSRKLRLENIKWSDDGEYRCVAYNVISHTRKEMASNTRFILHVIGPPEIQTRNGIYESISYAGESVHQLRLRFCSQPPPRLVSWQWGSSHITAGDSIQTKYKASLIEPITENNQMTNCYWAELTINNVQKEDARIYTLIVQSDKGKDSTTLKLIVRDPTETRVIAAAAAVGSLVLILLIVVGVYSFFRAKHRRYQREEEEGSIAADAFYNTSASTDRLKPPQTNINTQNKTYERKTSSEGGLAVMYNYDQVTKQTRTMSPEALEVRRAPAVLQPPTIV